MRIYFLINQRIKNKCIVGAGGKCQTKFHNCGLFEQPFFSDLFHIVQTINILE